MTGYFCTLSSDRLVSFRTCLFQHWLATTPIIAVLTPNYDKCCFFILEAKHRYHRLLYPVKQFFRKIDGDNSIAACHRLFVTSAVNINYVFWIRMTARTSATLTLSSSVFLGMTGDADSSGPALWPLTSLTTCGYILHMSRFDFPLKFVFVHHQTNFFMCVSHFKADLNILWAICGPAPCFVPPALMCLHWAGWSGAHGASSCCLWVHRPQCTGAAAGPHMGMCP